ncbi:MAG: hypothetical protein LC641_13650, partial [Spirochaeta sp.]|nr:hypothetical protein [Spirochaeta sp.]
MRFQRTGCLLAVLMLAGTGAAWGFNVSVTTPTLEFTGDLGGALNPSTVDAINLLLSQQAGLFQTEIEGNEDLQRFSQ